MAHQVHNKMVRLTKKQLQMKIDFISNYINAENASTGSTFDPNSNVTHKNVGTLMAELNKDINIQIKRGLVYTMLEKEFGIGLATTYIDQLEEHLIYAHDETAAVLPYCVAISLYPFITEGLKAFGGETKAPKHLSSYNGGLINLVFALSSQFAGAVAIVEYLLYFHYFAIKDYGEDYLETHTRIIEQELQQFVYAINQPAAARGMQSAFFNTSIFDEPYFRAIFGNTVYPDGTKPSWSAFSKLQRFFLKWFNKERTKALLTFPVLTCTLLTSNGEVVDKEYEQFLSEEISKGSSFFVYMSDTVDSLSSCCRLRNDISDQLNDFQYSLGAGGVMTGSVNVITLNMNRFVQQIFHNWKYVENSPQNDCNAFHQYLLICLKKQIALMHMYHMGFRRLIEVLQEQGMLPAYDAGFITLDKQYSTIGLNGVLEAAEFLNVIRDKNGEPTWDKYVSWLSSIFQTISETNKEGSKEYKVKFNTEMVPAESLGVKFADWDKKDVLWTPRDCYNSYLYPVEDDEVDLITKFRLHGKEVMQYMDGGSALHANLESWPTTEAAKKILSIAAYYGCPYFGINVAMTACNDCGYISKDTNTHCTKCGSKNIDYVTRVIGYLKRISSFSKERQREAYQRFYHQPHLCPEKSENIFLK